MSRLNKTWDDFIKTRAVGVEENRFIGSSDRVFTMGSCFANEIRLALSKRGFDVTPTLSDEFKKYVSPASHEMPGWGVYDERVHYQFYTTFSMLQEFEKAFGLWQHEETDIWSAVAKTETGTRQVFQEPYKRRLFADSLENLLTIRRLMEGAIRDGIMTSNVLVLTMGLTEIWQRANGRAVCEPPKLRSREIMQETKFFTSSFDQNLANMRRLCSLYFEAFPDRNIVLTVSPVALSRTFTEHQDIAVANMESKSILRTVAAQICREFKNVHYFPSFELCMTDPNAFEADGRHVRPAKVESIMSLFLGHFLTTPPAESKPAEPAPAAAPAAAAPAEVSSMVTDRRDQAGNAYESHWSANLAAIQQIIAGGERDLSRALNRLANPAEDSNATPLGQIGYRVAGAPVLSHTIDGRLEHRLFLAQKLWLLQRALPEDVTDIAELGSGSGNNLFALWLSGLPKDIQYHALEYTAAGRASAELLAGLAPEMKFRSTHFDYYKSTMDELREARKLFVFSCYSIEQITFIPDDFFDRLLKLPNLATALHIEPVGWQYGLKPGADAIAVEVDRRMRKSVARKGYNQSLVPQLYKLAQAGRIVIEEELPNVLAHRPDLPGTAIRWRPVR